MKNIKSFTLCIFLLSFISFINKSYGQSIERSLLKTFGEALVQENKNYLLKEKLSGTKVIEDPATGEVEISYGKNLVVPKEFQILSKDKQLRILNSPPLSIFPLKQRIELVDSAFLLTDGLEVKFANETLTVSREETASANVTKISLEKIGIRENEFLIWVSLEDNDTLYVFNFKRDNNKFSFVGITTLPRRRAYE